MHRRYLSLAPGVPASAGPEWYVAIDKQGRSTWLAVHVVVDGKAWDKRVPLRELLPALREMGWYVCETR